MLQLPEQIRHWRSIIWDVMGESIYQRVQSFTELAAACMLSPPPVIRFIARNRPWDQTALNLDRLFRTARADDEMRSFLLGAIEYLSSFAEENIEVPVSIIRAINDVERIAQIKESALPPAKRRDSLLSPSDCPPGFRKRITDQFNGLGYFGLITRFEE